MKNKYAFALFEMMVWIAILAILMGMLLPALNKAKQKANIKNQSIQSVINIGDVVYIDMNGNNITGKVNYIKVSFDYDKADLLIISTNGIPTIVPNIDCRLLKKVIQVEKTY